MKKEGVRVPQQNQQGKGKKMSKRHDKGIGIAIIGILTLLVVFSLYGKGLFSIASSSNYTLSQNINLYPNSPFPLGGAITAIGQTTIYKTSSGPGGLSGVLWYVDVTLNNAGEALFGSSGTPASSIASSLNSSATASSNPIGINFGIQNESFIVPYTNSNLTIFLVGMQEKLVSFNVPSASLGNSCSGQYYGSYQGFSNVYYITCSGVNSPETDFAHDLNGFSTACSQQNNNKATTLYIQYAPGVNLGSPYTIYMICAQPTYTPYTKGGIFTPQGTVNVFYNVSVYFTNTTKSQTIYLTPSHTSGYLNNQNVFAQIVALKSSGIQVGSSQLPAVIKLNNTQSSVEYVNPLLLGSAEALSIQVQTGANGGFLANWLQNPLNVCTGTAFSGCQVTQVAVYPYNLTQNQVSQYNNQIFGDIIPQNPANFYNGNLNPVNGTYDFIARFTNSFPYYPEIQLFAKENTLGITVPNSPAPKIVGTSPNPLQDTSGGAEQQESITVQNTGTGIGNYQISGTCTNGNRQFQSQAFSIQGGQEATQSVLIQTPYNPIGSAALTSLCSFTVYSTYQPSINATGTFTEITQPLPQGQTSTVVTTIAQNQSCQQTNNCSSSIGILVIILIIVAVGVALYLILKKGRR